MKGQTHAQLSQRLQTARRRALLAEHAPLADIVPQLGALRRLGLNEALFFLRRHWPHIAGEALARRTTPWSLKEGVLTVKADSPLYRQELTYAAPAILRIAQDHLGAETVRAVKAALD
jgi:predicted nucleic acid-binding Zn ribbon protein